MSEEQWWLSFCDRSKPDGSQFLGACIVLGKGIVDAAAVARMYGCNPGGEVVGIRLPTPMDAEYLGRLLTDDELDRFGMRIT